MGYTLSQIKRAAKSIENEIAYQRKLVLAREKLKDLQTKVQDLRDFNAGRIDSLGDDHPSLHKGAKRRITHCEDAKTSSKFTY